MDKLTRVFEVINRMVEEGVIRKYAITGAVAAMNYIEPTVTEDLDILVSIEDFENRASGIATLGPLTSFLSSLGYTDFRNEGVVLEDWPVQFLPVANDLDAEGLDGPSTWKSRATARQRRLKLGRSRQNTSWRSR